LDEAIMECRGMMAMEDLADSEPELDPEPVPRRIISSFA
jgi:hypothetical protein